MHTNIHKTVKSQRKSAPGKSKNNLASLPGNVIFTQIHWKKTADLKHNLFNWNVKRA